METPPKHPKTARIFTALLAALDVSASKLAREISTPGEVYSQQVLSNYVSGKSKPSERVLTAITRRYKAIDTNWLLTGVGEPFPNGRYDEKGELAAEPTPTYTPTAPTEPLVRELIQQLAEEKRLHREELREVKREYREDIRATATNHENILLDMRRQIDQAIEETQRVREEKNERIYQLETEIHQLRLKAGLRIPTKEEQEYFEKQQKQQQAPSAGFKPAGLALAYSNPDFIRPTETTEAPVLRLAA